MQLTNVTVVNPNNIDLGSDRVWVWCPQLKSQIAPVGWTDVVAANVAASLNLANNLLEGILSLMTLAPTFTVGTDPNGKPCLNVTLA